MIFKRGRRIRFWYKHLITIAISLVALPIIVPGLLYVLFETVTGVFRGQFHFNLLWIGAWLMAVLVYSVWFYTFYQKAKYQAGFWGKIYKLWLVNNNIVSQNMFIAKQDKNGKTKVTYFPRIYLKFLGKNGFKLFLPLDGNKFQARFKDGSFAHLIDTSTRSTVSDVVDVDGFKVYEYLTFPKHLRLSLEATKQTDHSIEIMTGFDWNFEKYPHMLLAGDTGSGKSYFIFSILSGLLKSGVEVLLADPKRTDLSGLSETTAFKGRVFAQTEDILAAFTQFYDDMMARADEYSEITKQNDEMGNYRSYGLNARFFVFDEFAAFVNGLGFREAETVKTQLGQITMLGRQLGYFVIIALQRPDADAIGSAARDQFQMRVSLGKMKSSGLAMVFPDDDPAQFVNLDPSEKGWGYAKLSPGEPRAFFAPLIPKGFKPKAYFDELGQILGIQPPDTIQTETVEVVDDSDEKAAFAAKRFGKK